MTAATNTAPTLADITAVVVDLKGMATRTLAIFVQQADNNPEWQIKLAKKELDRRMKLSAKTGKLV